MKNMISKTIRISLASCWLTAALASCGDFLEESSQDTDYVRSWKDLDELLIGDCYMPVYGSQNFYYQPNYGTFVHLLTDDVEEQTTDHAGSITYDSHEYEFGYYTWQSRVGVSENYSEFRPENTLWTKVYKEINIANNILTKLADLPQGTEAERQGALKVAGEAHFLRGYYYFFLVNLYGKPYDPLTAQTDLGVPIKTTQEVIDVKYERNTVQEVYDLVLSDLLAAEQELAQVTTEKKSLYRADVTAARLLLSRVYLYYQDWQKAADYARLVIEAHPQLQDLNTNKEKIMQKSNVENIFSMGGDDTSSLLIYDIKGLRISNELYNSYSINDLRRQEWMWKYNDFQGTLLHEYRMSGWYNTPPTPADPGYYDATHVDAFDRYKSPVSSLFWFRSAEAYLNLAEAEAYLGHDEAARTALNTLRAARMLRGSWDAVVTTSGSELISDIRKERRLEFVMQGHRWFDLRRYRVCSVQPEKKSITHDYTYYAERNSPAMTARHRFVLTEDDPSWTMPIPQEVIDFNTGMPNNGNQWRTYTSIEF